MIKHLWLALGFGLAVFVGVAVALAGPGATWPQAAPEQLSIAGLASGLTVALGALFVTVFLGLAAIDAIDVARARARLEHLIARAGAGEPIEPDEVAAALGRGALAEVAKGYAFTLRRDPQGERPLAGADPNDFFLADQLIADRLYVAAFRRLPALLIVISAATLAAGLFALLSDRAHGASAAALAANGQAVLIGCAFPLFGAVLVGAVVPAVAALRRRQLAALIGRVGLLCHGADEPIYTLRVRASPDGAADLKRSLGGAVGEAKRLFESLRRRVDERQAVRLSGDDASATAFERSLRAGLGELSRAIARLTEEQDKAVARLVQQCLTGFAAEFGSAVAGQIDSLQTILKATETAAVGLERSVSGAIAAAAASGARLDATSAGVEHKLEQVVERLGQAAVALGAAGERRPEGADVAASAPLIERLDRLAGTMTTQVEEARGSGGAMKQLSANVDSLCLSVAPVLNRLVETQDDLLAALSGDHSTSRLMADVADDLRQLSRANRDTLERHAQLAGEMVKIGQVLEGLTSATGGAPRPAAGPKVTDGLMRALRDLKTETDEAARSLPSLDHVA
jgi:hypothetical protein